MIAQGSRAILPYKIYVVIPGRGLLPVNPESVTTGQNYAESIGVMDSGLAHPSTSAQERAPE